MNRKRLTIYSLFRITGLAGTKIAEVIVSHNHCNTYGAGWLVGQHPSNVNETISAPMCFSGYNDECWSHTTIDIRNCGDFYLYYLEDVPGCYMRYCTE